MRFEFKHRYLVEAIFRIIDMEKDLESKLDMLTAIEITTTHDETLKICEQIRSQLVDSEEEVVPMEYLPKQEALCESEVQDGSNEYTREGT